MERWSGSRLAEDMAAGSEERRSDGKEQLLGHLVADLLLRMEENLGAQSRRETMSNISRSSCCERERGHERHARGPVISLHQMPHSAHLYLGQLLLPGPAQQPAVSHDAGGRGRPRT